MAVVYECWRHKVTDETYAVRLEGDRVTGFRHLTEVTGASRPLPDNEYHTDPDACSRLALRGSEFLLVSRVIR